jgi:hypothetical protein
MKNDASIEIYSIFGVAAIQSGKSVLHRFGCQQSKASYTGMATLSFPQAYPNLTTAPQSFPTMSNEPDDEWTF